MKLIILLLLLTTQTQSMFLRTQTTNKKIIGLKTQTSITTMINPKQLWLDFLEVKPEIPHQVGQELISIYAYPPGYFQNFNPATKFERWAACEVSDNSNPPKGLSSLELQGKYAIFLHKGTSQDFPKTLNYILQQWLPASEYELDDREHFEVLGENYKQGDPLSEEEVWIPIQLK